MAAVGLYAASWTLSSLYVNTVLNAMSADFYPRLTAVASDAAAVNRLVNEQTEVGILIATPGILATLALAPWVLSVFYSSEFLPATEVVRWQIVGVALRIVSWPIGFIILAKGMPRTFAVVETASWTLQVLLLAGCLRLWGLEGAGIAFLLLYVVVLFGVYLVGRAITGFSWSRRSIALITLCALQRTDVHPVADAAARGRAGAGSDRCRRGLLHVLEGSRPDPRGQRWRDPARRTPPAPARGRRLARACAPSSRRSPVSMPDRPLVTFAVFAHNHEAFIRQAVNGALAQTYRPLEIVLSDDASTDGTFAVLQETAAGYEGPHRVVLNRSPRRLGMAGHVNAVAGVSTGEYFVFSSGDDVSRPGRTEATVAPFLRDGAGRLQSVACRFRAVDESGHATPGEVRQSPALEPPDAGLDREERLRRLVLTLRAPAVGCAHTCRRSLLGIPGPLFERLSNEDVALGFRAEMLGEVAGVPEVLVDYRLHAMNVSHEPRDDLGGLARARRWRRRRWGACRNALNLCRGFERDLLGAREQGLVAPEEAERLLRAVRSVGRAWALLLVQRGAGPWRRLAVAGTLLRMGAPGRLTRAAAVRVLPWPAPDLARLTWLRVQAAAARLRLPR
jgi:hypothetical protein